MFRLLFACAWFANEQNNTSLTEFIKQVDVVGTEKLSVIPKTLLALLPIDGIYSEQPFNIDHLRGTDATPVDWVANVTTAQKTQPMCRLRLNDIHEQTSEHWRLLTDNFPKIAINLAMNPEVGPWNLKPNFVPELTSLIKRRPNDAIRHFLNWGSLQDNQSELFEYLKVNQYEFPNKKCQFQTNLRSKIFPFKLKFPKDTHLLSILAPALIAQLDFAQQMKFRINPHTTEDLSLPDILSAYGLSTTQLRTIAESSGTDKMIRASAIALYWLVLFEVEMLFQDKDKTKLNLVREKQLYAELVDKDNEAWLTRALIRGVLIHKSETNADALAFVTFMMERCKEGNGPLDELIELLNNWRERSTAPVNSKQVLEKWLGYNFQAPVYVKSAQ